MGNEIEQAFELNKDGSVDLTVEGKKVRFVKESDLGSVKSALRDKEADVSKLQAELAGTISKFDTAHQDVLKERAAKELLEKDAKEAMTYKEKSTTLEAQVAELTKSSGETQAKLTERLRSHLTTAYKIDKAKLADKALADLENIESSLKLTGVIPTPANYDGKGGNGSGASNLQGKSPLALAVMGYEQSKK